MFKPVNISYVEYAQMCANIDIDAQDDWHKHHNELMASMATEFSAGIDLRAREDVTIYAGETKVIPLGVEIDLHILKDNAEFWFGYKSQFNEDAFEHFLKSSYLALHIRSGLASKGLVQNNGTGVVDMDYPKELGLIVSLPLKPYPMTVDKAIRGYCRHTEKHTIKAGERVAQAILMEHKNYLLGYQSEVKRDGGFGSTKDA